VKDARMTAAHLAWWKAQLGNVKLPDLTRHAITDALDARRRIDHNDRRKQAARHRTS
jgi:hypothetical protein